MNQNVVIVVLIILFLIILVCDFAHKIFTNSNKNSSTFMTYLDSLKDDAMNILDDVVNNMDLQDINSYEEFRIVVINSAELTFKQLLVNSANNTIEGILSKYGLSDSKLDILISEFISNLIEQHKYDTIIKSTYYKLVKHEDE